MPPSVDEEIEWSFTTPQKASSGRPAPKQKPVRSVAQTRLDRTWQDRSNAEFQEFTTWRLRFWRNRTEYSTEWLLTWLTELERDLPRLVTRVEQPPAGWTGPRWDQAHEHLLRLQGQARALRMTLEERGALAGATSTPG